MHSCSPAPSISAPALEQVLARYGAETHALLQILCELQAFQGWLSLETLSQVAEPSCF